MLYETSIAIFRYLETSVGGRESGGRGRREDGLGESSAALPKGGNGPDQKRRAEVLLPPCCVSDNVHHDARMGRLLGRIFVSGTLFLITFI